MADVGEPALSPGAAFAAGAAAALAPVAKELEVVHERVRTGDLRLDEDAARRLLASIAAVQARVHNLIADSGEGIDRPLRLGDNFVAQAMSERLRAAASGGPDAAIPVLEEFSDQLEMFESIVRRAAGILADTDEEAGELIARAGEGGEDR
ncbi:hypothetical protein [Qaidamihabitans albus]|uniref:hypothetical protein n=1 Tax=Qaidamihabitans albus TaxID=2795733 RepID=UPI0018F23513|nr:hypothetical protein [Qaidamihabitans albus]